MRRLAGLVLTSVAVAGLSLTSTASAATKPAPGKFARCADLNAKYPHGVGKAGARDRVANKRDIPVKNFTVNTALYNLNAKLLDRDHDGIACEKR